MTSADPALPVKLLAALGVAVLLGLGLLGFGRISDDAGVSMGLTALWFGAVFVAGAALAWRRPGLRIPLALGYGLVAAVAAVAVVLPTLTDKEVDEKVVSAAPSPQGAGEERPAGNVQLAAGSFRPNAHAGSGRAAVVELPSGQRKLTLTRFETDAGPDLRVYVATGDPAGGSLGKFEDLGALKGNKGAQQYDLPKTLNLNRYSTVVVWCRAFSVSFTSAALREG